MITFIPFLSFFRIFRIKIEISHAYRIGMYIRGTHEKSSE